MADKELFNPFNSDLSMKPRQAQCIEEVLLYDKYKANFVEKIAR